MVTKPTTFDVVSNSILRELWADIERSRQKAEMARVAANPQAHRLTKVMPKGTAYTYWRAGQKKIGKRKLDRFKFCASKHTNAAGVFLIWEQVEHHVLRKGRWQFTEGERRAFQWAPTKREAYDLARRKAKRLREELATEALGKLPDAPPEVREMVDKAIDS